MGATEPSQCPPRETETSSPLFVGAQPVSFGICGDAAPSSIMGGGLPTPAGNQYRTHLWTTSSQGAEIYHSHDHLNTVEYWAPRPMGPTGVGFEVLQQRLTIPVVFAINGARGFPVHIRVSRVRPGGLRWSRQKRVGDIHAQRGGSQGPGIGEVTIGQAVVIASLRA